ncbi:MAG TPA: hypothetical protein VMW52_07890, partial [Phycisphaerae bacterium]|nr:hypothetical protein [Phycisphaerae bacterium]
GATHVVEITAKRRDRKITEMAKLARRLGAKILYELCSVPMKAVDELIPKGEQDAYVTEGHIGPRYITTTRKAAAEMAADKSSA